MIARILLIVCASAALSGCIVVRNDFTDSGFGPPPSGLNDVQTGTIGNGFGSVALVSGFDDDENEAVAYATLLTSTTGSPLPTSDVTYSGVYEIVGIDDVRYIVNLVGPDYVDGRDFTDTGTLTLIADVSAGSLTGTDGTLTVVGTHSGAALTGTVIYDGDNATLDGRLFAEGGIAAFHGNTNRRVFAGGLTMSQIP